MRLLMCFVLLLISTAGFGQQLTVGATAVYEYSPRLDAVSFVPQPSLHYRFPGAPGFVVKALLLPLLVANEAEISAGVSSPVPGDLNVEAVAGLGGQATYIMGTHYVSYARLESGLWKELRLWESSLVTLSVGLEVKQNLTNSLEFYQGERTMALLLGLELGGY